MGYKWKENQVFRATISAPCHVFEALQEGWTLSPLVLSIKKRAFFFLFTGANFKNLNLQ